MPYKPKFKQTDTSDWPIISQEKYAQMFAQIAAGLLATGHFSQPVNVDSDDDETSPGFDALLKERNWAEKYQPCVLEPAQDVLDDILRTCGMQRPELPDIWEEVEEA